MNEMNKNQSESIVIKYGKYNTLGLTEEDIKNVSIREGERTFHLMNYKNCQIYILDETSLMASNTIKSIDGCISVALFKRLQRKEKNRIIPIYCSGANTGNSLGRYFSNIGVESIFILPADNLDLVDLNSYEKVKIITIKNPNKIKKFLKLFLDHYNEKNKDKVVMEFPNLDIRLNSSRFRGYYIKEILNKINFNWLVQTVSAGFGPLGIYKVLEDLENIPKFLAVQQQTNPYVYYKIKGSKQEIKFDSTKDLLARVMYDSNPSTYSTVNNLIELIKKRGGIVILAKEEFDYYLNKFSLLGELRKNGVDISLNQDNDIKDKIGLMALIGALKAIDNGIINNEKGLICLTSGINNSKGKIIPFYQIKDDDLEKHVKIIYEILK